MRNRFAVPMLFTAVAALCALTGCSTLDRLGLDELIDEREWTWPESTPEPGISEEDAIARCVKAVVASFDIEDSSMYPEAAARASRLGDGWRVTVSAARAHPEEPTYYCITDGPDVELRNTIE